MFKAPKHWNAAARWRGDRERLSCGARSPGTSLRHLRPEPAPEATCAWCLAEVALARCFLRWMAWAGREGSALRSVAGARTPRRGGHVRVRGQVQAAGRPGPGTGRGPGSSGSLWERPSGPARRGGQRPRLAHRQGGRQDSPEPSPPGHAPPAAAPADHRELPPTPRSARPGAAGTRACAIPGADRPTARSARRGHHRAVPRQEPGPGPHCEREPGPPRTAAPAGCPVTRSSRRSAGLCQTQSCPFPHPVGVGVPAASARPAWSASATATRRACRDGREPGLGVSMNRP